MSKVWLVSIATGILTCLVAGSLFLLSPANSSALVTWAVDTFTDHRLELVDPSINILEGSASATEIHLYQDESKGPPLISVLGFSASTTFWNLLTLDLDESNLSATNVIVYVSKSDSTEDPHPATWLGYARLLPASLSVGTLHVIAENRNVWIFPVKAIKGLRTSEQLFSASGKADYQGEPLQIGLDVHALRDGQDFTGLEMGAQFIASQSNSSITILGELKGDNRNFQYEYSLSADYKEIKHFLKGFDVVPNTIDGALRIEGNLSGDLSGFVLSAESVVLDNMPTYGLEAGGELRRQFDSDLTEINLVFAGELKSPQELMYFTDLDLSSLGRTQASITLSGSLHAPVVEHFVLQTQSSTGLNVHLSGELGTKGLLDGVLSPSSKIRADISAPSLSVLDEWLGAQPAELGSWQASALIRGDRETAEIESIVAEIGSSQTLHSRLQGSIGHIDLRQPFSLSSIQQVAAQLSFDTTDSAILGTWLNLPVPARHSLQGQAELSGSGDDLELTNGAISISSSDLDSSVSQISASIRHEKDLTLSNLKGMVNATLSDTSALSQYAGGSFIALGQVHGTGKLVQKADRFGLEDVRVNVADEGFEVTLEGEIDNLNTLSGADFNLRFLGLQTSDVMSSQFPNFNYSNNLGELTGAMRLQVESGNWQLTDINITNIASEKVMLDVRGSINNVEGLPTGDLQADFRTTDAEILSHLTGLNLATTAGRVTLKTAPGKANIGVSGLIGSTAINSNISIEHAEKKITSLGVDLHTPHLYLADLGLQTDINKGGTYRPSEQLQPIAQRGYLKNLLNKVPPFETDIAVRIEGLTGDNTSINELDVHITGVDNRHTLRKFDVVYDTGRVEIRGIVDLNPDPIAVSLAGLGFTIPVDNLRRDLAFEADVAGSLTFRGGLTARGTEREELIGSLNGSLAFALENAVIEGAAYDLLATNALEWIYSGAAMEKSTKIDCTLASFSIVDGVAKTNDLFLDTKHMIGRGKGTLDFVKRYVDFRITPSSKSRALQIPSSVTIRGKMSKPDTIVSPIAATANASAEAIMLVPNLVMKMFGVRDNDKKRVATCLPQAQ